MKKTYFAPAAKTIDLSTESPLLSDSLGKGDDWNSGEGDSNRRKEGKNIWGNTEW